MLTNLLLVSKKPLETSQFYINKNVNLQVPEQIACITLEINMIVRDLLVAGSHKHSNQRESYFMKPI